MPVSNETLLIVGRFTLLWATFEYRFYRCRCSERRIPEVNNFDLSDELLLECDYLKEYLYEHSNNIDEMLRGLRFYNQRLKDMCISWLENNVFSINAVIGIIYRIRCNSFHGEKIAYRIEGQSDLFEIASNILDLLLEENG